jgi:hypothetical protein
MMNSRLVNQDKSTDFFDILRLRTVKQPARIPLLGADKKTMSWAYGYITHWRHDLEGLRFSLLELKKLGYSLEQTIKKYYEVK